MITAPCCTRGEINACASSTCESQKAAGISIRSFGNVELLEFGCRTLQSPRMNSNGRALTLDGCRKFTHLEIHRARQSFKLVNLMCLENMACPVAFHTHGACGILRRIASNNFFRRAKSLLKHFEAEAIES